ncbi:chorismate mutase [Pyrofollis japonicus]|uniref:prephenate dehydrogenase/arogenate dehydrogenase family protein n=1 Tax=Pyrofollis japonicus TaxID=3060460 RepID=UPI00295A7AF8|nr:prephenate dehydrogenase/arogenate dehydrogenase family protein [Pyrofollis japonicus]BEP17819.1 chorismate mutase [Pyrofollis japonicus]
MEEVAREELRALRSTLENIDTSILRLIAARLGVVRSISKIKRSTGLPVYDDKREKELLATLSEEARRLGLSEELVEHLYTVLIKESRCAQLYCAERLRVYIYGYGGMAATFAENLLRAGCWVAIGGRSEEKAQKLAERLGAVAMEPCRGIDWADMVIYAVPGSAVPGLFKEHVTCARRSMLFTDLASAKKPLVPRIEEILGGAEDPPEYASLHPLFGPVHCIAGERVAVIPVRLVAWKPRLMRLLNGLGLKAVELDPDTHDRIMAVNQVLHHLVYDLYRLASQRLARKLGISEEQLKGLVTRSLRSTMSVAERLELLHGVVDEIRKENPYSREALSALLEALESLS